MQIKLTHTNPTEAILVITPNEEDLAKIKQIVLKNYQPQVKAAGFREGKAPLEIVEKNVDPQALQAKFVDEALEQFYRHALIEKQLRPIDNPKITLKKFVPFTTLEFEASVEVLGNIELADYKKFKIAKPKVEIVAKDVDDILNSLRTRMSEKVDVDRVSKNGDQVWIDFKGTDTKGKPVSGADGKDYPLLLGSKTFIPGFEENLVGVKANDNKIFTLTFPKDYGVKALAGSKVTFNVDVTKVQEVKLPKLDDEFAKKAGPFTDLKSLKADIKKQVTLEKQNQADRDYESSLIKAISDKSKVDVPEKLISNQVDNMINAEKQNVLYRGQTWEEYLKSENVDEAGLRNKMKPFADDRVKASLVLSEIADKEKVTITKEELEERITALKSQYKDAKMQEELNKDEARQDIASRILTEKTIKLIVGYNN